MFKEYKKLNSEFEIKIKNNKNFESQYKFKDENAVRRDKTKDKRNFIRPNFERDIEKILYLPAYNRYSDKTQVFSLNNNDDITRRSLHVQFVSRIARNIGRVLGLNLDLIEAISLGHDLGHTPFGHAGESLLNELYYERTNRYFNHNVHSVRVLDTIYNRNVTLQTLDGILCHNGEFELEKYIPSSLNSFDEFDEQIESCYKDKSEVKKLVPSTLEGCVVRISDMIAYIGKDRQDAVVAGLINKNNNPFKDEEVEKHNALIINNLTVDIIENSYGKGYIKLSDEAYKTLKEEKKKNYDYIYKAEVIEADNKNIKPMFEKMYDKLLSDLKEKDETSFIYKHHINDVLKNYDKKYKKDGYNYLSDETMDDIVVDYIASMTDDYFISLYKKMFPYDEINVKYKSYFQNDK